MGKTKELYMEEQEQIQLNDIREKFEISRREWDEVNEDDFIDADYEYERWVKENEKQNSN